MQQDSRPFLRASYSSRIRRTLFPHLSMSGNNENRQCHRGHESDDPRGDRAVILPVSLRNTANWLDPDGAILGHGA